MREEKLKSEKYKSQLLSIKKSLMLEIETYLKNGVFKMKKLTVIPFLTSMLGVFNACFDTIESARDEDGLKKLKLFNKTNNRYSFAYVMSFEMDETIEVEREIPFLMTLLDYINMDYKEYQKTK